MKISKFNGTDMRRVLKTIREEIGPDAVILDTQQVGNGVEVTVAVDHDRRESSYAPQPTAPAPAPAFESEPVILAPGVTDELQTLRRILETQVAQLTWGDFTRRAPLHTEILRELSEIGFTAPLATQVIAQLPPSADLTQSRRHAIAVISQMIPTATETWLTQGACVAFLGPTGAGKTTTLAKLAVRWTLQHGAQDLALVSADTTRMGSHDVLHNLGQMLGASTFRLDDLADFGRLLPQLHKYKCVFIDTSGLSVKDPLLDAQLHSLTQCLPHIETTLVLAATTQAGAIQQTLLHYAKVRPRSCILTKLDEATSIGGILSNLIQHDLPITYTSEGQRIPEDLRPARALELVTQAVQLARGSGATADEDLLCRRFGEVAHALA
jgi:flagellar biosynthesis protein FlhF